MEKIKNAFININLFIWMVLFCILSIEVIFRIVSSISHTGIGYQLKDDYHVPKPYVMASAKPGALYGNQAHGILGYRDFPRVEKPQDEFRIIVLGGSTVHGGEVTLSENIEYLVHNKGFKNVKVYNAGVGSSVVRQDINRILFDIAGYKPDLLIHYVGGNDLLRGPDVRINYPHRFVFYEGGIQKILSSRFDDLIFKILLGSEFARHFFHDYLIHKFSQESALILPPIADRPKLRAESLAQNLVLSQLLSANIGAKYIAVFQPMLYYKKSISKDEQVFLSDEEALFQLGLREILFKSQNLKHINSLDCSDVFENVKATVYDDPIHLKEKFRVMPAKCIVDHLLKDPSYLSTKNFSKLNFIPEEYFILGYPKR